MAGTDLLDAARDSWDKALEYGVKWGYRNAQATVLAPTGTIGLVMDCDTTGIEPDYSLVKYKKLAGGGFFKIVNQSVPLALRKLGYSETEIQFVDQLRYFRNGMLYYGTILDKDYAEKVIEFTKRNYFKIKGMM